MLEMDKQEINPMQEFMGVTPTAPPAPYKFDPLDLYTMESVFLWCASALCVALAIKTIVSMFRRPI